MTLAGFRATNHPQQTAKRGATDDVDDRGTDQTFFDATAERFGGFTLDVAAAPHNAKCDDYWTREDDALTKLWLGRVWCNPPFSDCGSWVRKAWEEWRAAEEFGPHAGPSLIVMLLPANRVEQKWWQEHVEPYRDRPGSPLRVEFLPGRMRFDRPGWTAGPKGDRPPFGCCLLIWERASDNAEASRLDRLLTAAATTSVAQRAAVRSLEGALGEASKDNADLARQLTRASESLGRVRDLHRPVHVPAIGPLLTAFTRCSCTPGLLYDECPTAAALDGEGA